MNNLDTNDNGSIPVRVQEYKSKVDAPYMSSHMMGCNDSQLQYDCTIILFEPSQTTDAGNEFSAKVVFIARHEIGLAHLQS